MSTTPEGKVKRAVRALLREFNVNYVKTPTTAGYGSSGDFDIRCVFHGVSVGIETKATDKDMPTRLQTKNAVEHYEAGGVSMCIHKTNVTALRMLLTRLQRRHPVGPELYWPQKALDDYNMKKESGDVQVISQADE